MRLARGRALRLAVLLLCLAWLGWILASLGPRRVLEVARQADPAWLALSVVALAGRYLIWTVKWNLMLRRRGPIGLRATARALLAGNFVNLTTPTAKLAGGFVRAALVKRRTGWGMATAYGWSLADQVTNVLGNLTLYGLLALGAGATLPAGGPGRRLVGSGAAALGAVAAALSLRGWAWRGARRPAVSRLLARFTPERFRSMGEAAWLRPVLEPVLHHGRTWRVAPQDLGLAACAFGSLCLANALVLQSLGVEAPLLLVAAAVVVGYFAGTLVGTLGGVGVTEVALIKLYGLAGISPDAATAGALLHRATYYGLVLAWGGWALAIESRGGSKLE
jgi:uncharacterized membrane protein YbhN (UPF0104 family)